MHVPTQVQALQAKVISRLLEPERLAWKVFQLYRLSQASQVQPLGYGANILFSTLSFFFVFCFFGLQGKLSTLRQQMKVPNEPGLSPNNGLENVSLSDQSMASNPRKGQAKCPGAKTTSHEWTNICLCLSGIFAQAPTHILRASYSADIGTNTDTTSNLSSTCVVLELVAGGLDCQPRPNNQQQTLQLFLSSFRRQQFYLTVNIASEMHFNAFQCIAQNNTALHDCMLYLTCAL